jgi:hypothetical protein
MSFAGLLVLWWLTLAAVAFAAISLLGRLAGRGDVDAELGIVGASDLRMLLATHEEQQS